MRAVNVHQPFTERGEDVQGGGRAVDELAVDAAGAESAFDHELVTVARFEAVFIEKFLERRAESGDLEDGFDRATVAAAAEEGAIGPSAEHEVECADEDRFAGAGFAGDGVVAGLKLEGEVGDQSEVFNAQGRQHGKIGSC